MNKSEIVDKLKSNIHSQSTQLDQKYLKLLACSLSTEDLEEIMDCLKEQHNTQSDKYSICMLELERKQRSKAFKDKQYESLVQQNEPVGLLMDWYQNKKSGRVSEARLKLCKRFLYLSYYEQLAIIKAMVQSCKTDREWCYGTMLRWWSTEIKECVLELWEKYHEEHCAVVITKHFPVEELREMVDELSIDSNYYHLCKKLVNENWFRVDKHRLRSQVDLDKFIWIMSQTKERLTDDEITLLYYTKIAQSISFYYSQMSSIPLLLGGSKDDLFPDSCSGRDEDDFYITNITSMSNFFSCLCRMGKTDTVEFFLSQDKAIHDEFINHYQDEISGADPSSKENDLLMKFLNMYSSHYPEQYRFLLPNFEDKMSGGLTKNKSETMASTLNDVTVKSMIERNSCLEYLILDFRLSLIEL